MGNTIGNDGGKNYSQEYLNVIKNETLTRMDKAGNGVGKVTVNEALHDLDIGGLLNGQNAEDTAKIKAAAQNIEQVLTKYAGPDGTFTFEEYRQMKNDPVYKQFVEQYHVVPWFKFFGLCYFFMQIFYKQDMREFQAYL